jgi:16S rRNA G966 N2-methylase RsmD
MNNIFIKYPEFIESDVRTSRNHTYKISSDFMIKRFECFFKNLDLKNKKILDIGCHVGAAGAWVLSNGAAFYQGVEANEEIAIIARENFKKHFDKNSWNISNQFIEDFLETSSNFDIIIASGVIYCFFDPIPIIKKLTEKTDVLIIESMEPPINLPKGIQDFVYKANYLKEHPILIFVEQLVTWGNNRESVAFNGSRPSSGFVKYYLNILGFDCVDIDVELQKILPEVYNTRDRYAYQFLKNKNIKTNTEGLHQEFINNSQDLKVKKWLLPGNLTKK